MNRRNLFKYLSAAAAMAAVPALARASGPRFRIYYHEESSPYTVDGRAYTYDAVAQFADKHICFFGLDHNKRDDAYGRKFLEAHIRAEEKKHGRAVDASYRHALDRKPGVWV